MSFYVSTATFFLLHCDEWDRIVALPRHKFVTGATLLQVMFSVFTSSVVGSGLEPRLDQAKDYKNCICCFFTSTQHYLESGQVAPPFFNQLAPLVKKYFQLIPLVKCGRLN